MTALVLGPEQRVPRRPFTAVENTAVDLEILSWMLDDLRRMLGEWLAGNREITPYERIAWVRRGLRRRLVVCAPETLLGDADLCVVGFLARRNPARNLTALERANTAIVREFKDYPGILSYSSCELEGGNWANLVLNDDPSAPERWRQSVAHATAANQLSPEYYLNVRIHNGSLPGGVMGGNPIVLARTKYYDYRARGTVWKAERTLAG